MASFSRASMLQATQPGDRQPNAGVMLREQEQDAAGWQKATTASGVSNLSFNPRENRRATIFISQALQIFPAKF